MNPARADGAEQGMKGPEESGSGEKWVKMFQHPANEAITKLVQLIADEAVRLRVDGLGI